VFLLYSVQAGNYLMFLITIPYLARVMGPSGWGLVAFTMTYALYVKLIVEYGFDLAGTREVARNRRDKSELSSLIAGIFGAKILLALPLLAASVIFQRVIPLFRDNPFLLWTGVFWAVSQSFNMNWYFRGFEKMNVVAAFTGTANLVFIFLVFIFIHQPDDGWKLFSILGVLAFLSAAIAMAIVYREVPFRLPRLGISLKALKTGWSMFLFRGPINLYTMGNTFILGFFAPANIVGYYGGIEKIVNSILRLFTPINETLFPRLTYQANAEKIDNSRIELIGGILMIGFGIALGCVLFFSAPIAVRLLLGPEFKPAVSLMRTLSVLPPLTALSNLFGIHRMLPKGLDRQFNKIIVRAVILDVVLAVILAPRFAHFGMAWTLVAVEAFVAASMFLCLKTHKKSLKKI
ncbi:MAG: oligosaccharide flippase family protein, partial [Candidatus Omnitrophica bacterium]|nr:oligosaccharide flippase family protein [Candidatus Omnitrophota bacterium]